ncbi:hypothetical protein K1719_011786 [Acacia pycnantha]|nr:hypothetical protein K1719_011786 [Acacia pycnantha]
MEPLWLSLSGFVASRHGWAILLVLLLTCSIFTSTEAYDALDPTGNITIKWDVISWTPDGYVLSCCFNVQLSAVPSYSSSGMDIRVEVGEKGSYLEHDGRSTTEQGDCSRFKGNIPHCCKKDPTVVDLLPGTPYNQQIANCCRGGVLNSWAQDPTTSKVRPSKFFTNDKRRTTQALMTWNITCPLVGYGLWEG